MEARQRVLRNLEKRLHGSRPPERHQEQRRLLYRQSKEDFELLQIVSHRLSNAVGPDSPPDYAGIRNDAAEIRKRASRLKTNLLLPKPEGGEKRGEGEGELTPEELGPAAAALDALVKRFVWNPVFQQPGVVSAENPTENPTRARHDLDGIIRLSERIRRSAETLGRASAKRF